MLTKKGENMAQADTTANFIGIVSKTNELKISFEELQLWLSHPCDVLVFSPQTQTYMLYG